eukprot:1722344-Rhodomonas_salina.1
MHPPHSLLGQTVLGLLLIRGTWEEGGLGASSWRGREARLIRHSDQLCQINATHCADLSEAVVLKVSTQTSPIHDQLCPIDTTSCIELSKAVTVVLEVRESAPRPVPLASGTPQVRWHFQATVQVVVHLQDTAVLDMHNCGDIVPQDQQQLHD